MRSIQKFCGISFGRGFDEFPQAVIRHDTSRTSGTYLKNRRRTVTDRTARTAARSTTFNWEKSKAGKNGDHTNYCTSYLICSLLAFHVANASLAVKADRTS